MKVATFNIDWAKKNKNHYLKIESDLKKQTFDFLILTESIDLNLPNYKFKYFSEPISGKQVFEEVNYSGFLQGKSGFRTVIYSQTPCVNSYKTFDPITSLALEFETNYGIIVLYATIIGTQFRKLPYAKTELENCIKDCRKIYTANSNLFIIGDLNTSFQPSEKI